MALLGNYTVLNKSVMRKMSGVTESAERSNFGTSGAFRNRQLQDRATTALAGYAIPEAYYPSYTWMIPQRAGNIGSESQISGAANAAVNLAGGINGAASLSGAGNVLNANAGLIISMVATLAGTGTVASADLRALLSITASISGGGSVAASLSALAWANAALTAGGNITNATPYATGALSAAIKSYGDLTPEGLRDAVWNALGTSYATVGTMGAKLNSAASGGVDYPAMGSAVRAELAAELLRIIELAKLHGLIQGTDLVVTPTSRTAGTVVQTISGGANQTTISRT